ncbi:hypothetical protein [uncultured Nostoc sp.]|uniref:hypothetical protein n=1 Tax=uncultured Nostoc sp. TaxID=340711 RepID=UPI0035C99A4D
MGKQRSQGGFLDWGTVPEDMFILTEICDVYDGLRLRAIVCYALDYALSDYSFELYR